MIPRMTVITRIIHLESSRDCYGATDSQQSLLIGVIYIVAWFEYPRKTSKTQIILINLFAIGLLKTGE